MMAGAAELMMTLALCCLPRDSSEWGQVMLAEYDLARVDGKGLGFACGCLIAVWCQLPLHAGGQIALVSHVLVVGLIVPIATFHLGCAFSGARFILSGRDHYHAMLMASGAHGRILADAYITAAPALTLLLLLLGSAHLAVAWFLLAGRWHRATLLWLMAMIIAALIVHIITTAIPTAGGRAIQFAALAIEVAAIPLLATLQKTRANSSHLKDA